MKTLLAGVGLACTIFALAETEITKVAYPHEYRQWFHVKSTLIGSQHANFATNGGIHHFYANEKALQGYKTGKFPDGSVLIDDLLEVTENAGATSEGARRRVAVMAKEASRYSATGGWGSRSSKATTRHPCSRPMESRLLRLSFQTEGPRLRIQPGTKVNRLEPIVGQ